MPNIKNSFKTSDSIKVKWNYINYRESRLSRNSMINPSDSSTDVPIIHPDDKLTIQAFNERNEAVESRLILKPPFQNDHVIELTYDKTTFCWTITGYQLPDSSERQVNVNIEIGPK